MGKLWAGSAKKEINPPLSLPLSGYIRRQGETKGMHDPLEVNVLWLDDGHSPLIFLTLDVLLLEDGYSSRLKKTIASEVGIPEASILSAATHTHSAPAIHDFRNLGFRDPQWEEMVLEMAVGASRQAQHQARRGSWSCRSTEIRLGRNRRQLDGPADFYFPVALIIDAHDNPLALFANYACHPVVLDEKNLLISADYVGAYRQLMRAYLSIDFPILFFIGADGDVDPAERGSFELARKMGLKLKEASVLLFKEMNFSSEIKLASKDKLINLPLSQPYSLEEIKNLILDYEIRLAEAEKKLQIMETSEKRITQAFLLWARELAAKMEAGEVPTSLSATISAFRLQDLLFLAHPFELFASTSLRLRRELNPDLWFAGYSQGYGGYLPDEEAYAAGGYEVEEAYRYFGLLPFSAEAEKKFRAEVVSLTETLGD